MVQYLSAPLDLSFAALSDAPAAGSSINPSKEAFEEALQGSAAALPEQLDQLDDLLSSKGE